MSLIIHWPCSDNAESTVVTDVSGNALHGALEGGQNTTNVQLGSGPGNTLTSAFNLTETAGERVSVDKATITAVEWWNNTNFTMSMSGWFRATANQPTVRRIMFGFSDDDSSRDLFVTTGVGKKIDGYAYFNGYYVTTHVHPTDDTEWVFVVLTQDGAYGDINMWINGAQATRDASSTNDGASNWNDGEINKIDRFMVSGACNLKFADIRLYDHVLTESEIKTLYGLGFTGTFASVTSPADAANINHDSGDAGTVLTVTAAGDTPTPTFAVSGTDGAQFNINPTTGVLTFASAPNHAAPTDANGDNVYHITLTAVHPAGDDSVNVTVTVVSAGPPVNTVAPVVTKVV